MPLSGKVIEFNTELDESEGDNPAAINEDPYGKGWIVKVEISDMAEVDELLTSEAYEGLIA